MNRIVWSLVSCAALVACKNKSTCDKAVDRMVECKIVVGNLLPKNSGEVHLEQAKGTLTGACDAVVDGSGPDKSIMECAAKASSCDELIQCSAK